MLSRTELIKANELLEKQIINLKIKIIELENEKGGYDELKQRYNEVLDKVDELEKENECLKVENEHLKTLKDKK